LLLPLLQISRIAISGALVEHTWVEKGLLSWIVRWSGSNLFTRTKEGQENKICSSSTASGAQNRVPFAADQVKKAPEKLFTREHGIRAGQVNKLCFLPANFKARKQCHFGCKHLFLKDLWCFYRAKGVERT